MFRSCRWAHTLAQNQPLCRRATALVSSHHCRYSTIFRPVAVVSSLGRLAQSSFPCRFFNSAADASAAPITPCVVPRLQITFTCKACDHRSTHEMSKQAYTTGTVLIQCPSCKNRHLIADNLKIFKDSKTNIEDILAEKGEFVQRGVLRDGDIEVLPNDEKWLA